MRSLARGRHTVILVAVAMVALGGCREAPRSASSTASTDETPVDLRGLLTATRDPALAGGAEVQGVARYFVAYTSPLKRTGVTLGGADRNLLV